MTHRAKLEKQLQECLQHWILLSVEDKRKWLTLLPTLTDELLVKTILAIKEKNSITDEYINSVLKTDKNRKKLTDLKLKIKKIKTKAQKIEEKTTKKNAEKNLQEQIKNL